MHDPNAAAPAPREYNPRTAFIPYERDVKGFGDRYSSFQTSDRTVYVRFKPTGAIRRHQPKAKGKAARKAEKRARREARAR